MRLNQLPLQSLRRFWRSSLATLAGMAIGAAVLTGALIVGDSIRHSLKQMTLERLGAIDHAMVMPRLVHQKLADGLAASDTFKKSFEPPVPAMLMRAVVENADTRAVARGVSAIGVTPQFWALDKTRLAIPDLKSRETVINERLAREIGIKAGDALILRFDRPSAIPSEAVFGRKTERIESIRLTVAVILPDRGLARFAISPAQQTPMNIFVPLETLQRSLKRPDMINAVFVSEKAGAKGAPESLEQALESSATLEDIGLKTTITGSPAYASIESVDMTLDPREIDIIETRAAQNATERMEIYTYLANTARVGERETPYSIVTALSPISGAPGFKPLRSIDGSPMPELKDGEIYINSWLAEDLGTTVGASLTMDYYVESPAGGLKTETSKPFIIRGIVAMEDLGADAGLTPEYPGIQNAKKIRDWDPPFPVDLSRVRNKDEDYWDKYGATPKAFINIDEGKRMWASRFGALTAIRLFPFKGEPESAQRLLAVIRGKLSAREAGLVFQPVKAQGLQASGGATDFAGLFIGFSFFIIAAALTLTRMFFALGVERRAREIGALMAMGFTARQVRALFLREGALLAVAGAAVGALAGVGYAKLALHGLATWWSAAVGVNFLWLKVNPVTLIYGFLGGVATALLSVWLAIRPILKTEPARLLAGGAGAAGPLPARAGKLNLAVIVSGLLIAAGSGVAGAVADAQTQAGLFFAGGAAGLAGALALASRFLRTSSRTIIRPDSSAALARLGALNARRNPGRTGAMMTLMGSATFILIAVAAFRHTGGPEETGKDTGTGGYALMAESEIPLLADLNDEAGRDELGLSEETKQALDGARVFALRLNPGQDVSCLNLYRPTQPRILGAPPEFIERGGFKFASRLVKDGPAAANPWKELERPQFVDALPAIADMNTVMWILHSGLGKTFEVTDEQGRKIPLRFVALLKGSALQGEIVISEKFFKRLYPSRSGRSMFFIEPKDPTHAKRLAGALERDLSDYGFDAYPTRQRIESYLVVENTYISAFQALGGLGLLLGSFGVAAVALRNMVERRGELALMQAVGFTRGTLGVMTLSETLLALALGLGVGAGAAAIAVAPQLLASPGELPWGILIGTLAGSALVGLISGALALGGLSTVPILEALREK